MWDKTNETDLGRRVAALEAQTVDLQQRVKTFLGTVEVRYAPVDDHRDKERPVKPAPMMVCELAETCVQTRCQSRVSHVLRDNCTLSCCARDGDEGRCIPVPAPAAPVTADDEARVAFQGKLMDGMVRAGAIPVELSSPSKPAPELVRCEVVGCTHTSCGHLAAHWKEPLCSLGCTRFKSVRCIPVPAQEPVVAIPDVPTPVGTDAFRREMTGHMQTLAQAYSWDADSLPELQLCAGHDYLERLAGVACTLRDAYDLARTGEHQAAQEKLEEIEW